MAFSTTIKKDIWFQKLRDQADRGHFWEYKDFKPHWKRLEKLEVPCKGVFLVGGIKKPQIVEVLERQVFKREHIPEQYGNVVTTEYVHGLKCVHKPEI